MAVPSVIGHPVHFLRRTARSCLPTVAYGPDPSFRRVI